MNEKAQEITDEATRYEGSAVDIGGQVFSRRAMPILTQASEQMSGRPAEITALYAGFFSGFSGALAAEFGDEFSIAFLRKLVDLYEANPCEGRNAGPKH